MPTELSRLLMLLVLTIKIDIVWLSQLNDLLCVGRWAFDCREDDAFRFLSRPKYPLWGILTVL